jgi:hypothetical protein
MVDGTEYYPPGGGCMSNGDGAIDYMYQMQLRRTLEHREAEVCRCAEEILASLSLRSQSNIEVKARFTIDYPEGFAIDVYEPTSNVSLKF